MKLRKPPEEAEIPTSSMADIAFLLIIFFMVTAVFSATKGLEFKLPDDEDQPQDSEADEAVFIKVASDGSITADCKPIKREDILEYLEPILTVNRRKPVVLYTEPDAPYEAMMGVYDVLIHPEEQNRRAREADPPDPEPYDWKVQNISIPTQTDIKSYIEIFGENPFETRCAG